MMLIKNIGLLVLAEEKNNALKQRKGLQMQDIPTLDEAWIKIIDDRIDSFGKMSEIPDFQGEVLDAQGGVMLPAWCDSHTHMVFATTREEEFVLKIKGKTYAEIAAAGGGILNSAARLAELSEDELYERALIRLKKAVSLGTGAIEIKSGYGLSLEAELKMLRVIRRLKQANIIPIKATFLGAHALPRAFEGNKAGYIDHVINDMLPQVAEEGLADYIDVFCEEGFFDEQDTERIILAGKKFGLKAKIHANQLHRSGGVQTGVRLGALSVDHLETMGKEEIEYLRTGNTIPVLLPGAAFFLRMNYPPARDLLNADLPVTVASDFNPGSSPVYNMNMIFSLACIQMKMTPEEAIAAMTINGAAAMELSEEVGSIVPGKLANLIITKPVKSLAYLPYSFGEHWIDRVFISGKEWKG